jgi:hypothetical protein
VRGETGQQGAGDPTLNLFRLYSSSGPTLLRCQPAGSLVAVSFLEKIHSHPEKINPEEIHQAPHHVCNPLLGENYFDTITSHCRNHKILGQMQ